MALEFVAAQVLLASLVLRSGDDDGAVGAIKGVSQKLGTRGFLEMFDDIAGEDDIVTRTGFDQFAGISEMDFIVKIPVHFGDVLGVTFDTIDADLPVRLLITRGIPFGFENIGVFPE